MSRPNQTVQTKLLKTSESSSIIAPQIVVAPHYVCVPFVYSLFINECVTARTGQMTRLYIYILNIIQQSTKGRKSALGLD